MLQVSQAPLINRAIPMGPAVLIYSAIKLPVEKLLIPAYYCARASSIPPGRNGRRFINRRREEALTDTARRLMRRAMFTKPVKRLTRQPPLPGLLFFCVNTVRLAGSYGRKFMTTEAMNPVTAWR